MGKKILFVLPWLKVGGLERVQVNIANALSSRGHDVTILALNPENDLFGELDKRVKYVYKPYKPHKIMKRLPYIRHKFYDDGMWETRASANALYKYYVGNEKYDVEIGFFRGLSIKIISGSTNKNSVKLAWVHNDFTKCSGIDNNFKNRNETIFAYGKFDKIVCVSNQAKDGFIKTIGYNDKTLTIYNLLPIERIKALSQEPCNLEFNKFTVLSVGRLTRQKGYERLISAVKSLAEEGYSLDLCLIGDGEERDDLLKHIEDEKISNVKLLGKKLNPYPYMKNADLYVCSSLYEGYNLTVAEALILGTPVLSTDCTGPKEILDNGKYGLVVDNSEFGLYNGIKKILDNREILIKLKKRAEE